MGAIFEVDDVVKFNPKCLFGVARKKPKGIRRDKSYIIARIDRGIDGAYDWDDLYLVGVEGRFCEFDFTKESQQ